MGVLLSQLNNKNISLFFYNRLRSLIRKTQTKLNYDDFFCLQDDPNSRLSGRPDRIIVLVVLASGLGLLAVIALLARQRLCCRAPSENELKTFWPAAPGRYVTATTLGGEKATTGEHPSSLGLLIDTPNAMNEFSSGQSASCPLYESSSDLLLLRVEGCRVKDTDQLLSDQRRSLNWDRRAVQGKVDRVLSKMCIIFENVFKKHQYIDVK